MPALVSLLNWLIDNEGSDLHLSAQRPPFARVQGVLEPIPDQPVFSSNRILELLKEILPEQNFQELVTTRDTDCAYTLGEHARLRVNGFCDMHGYGAVLRLIPDKIPTFSELGLPPIIQDFCRLSKGLVIITGPTGCGKSTSLAAMIEFINQRRNEHIITIEDPIEFVYTPKRCLINQREVYRDTRSFAHALRAALREDPDIILVGELRDLETMEMAIETAETGHLVFATLHTNNASTAVERLIDKFPENRQNQIRSMLSDTLRGVVAQVLCKRIDGKRVAAFEILVANHAVASLIRESQTHMLPSVIQTGRTHGMQTFSDELTNLVSKGIISAEEAYTRVIDKIDIETKFKLAGISLDFKKAAEELVRNTALTHAQNELQELRENLQLSPEDPQVLCQVAWFLATCHYAELRNGREAVKLAEKACALTGNKDPYPLETLSIAHAENGAFRRALNTANQAAKLYSHQGDTPRAQAVQNRCNLFKQNKPIRYT